MFGLWRQADVSHDRDSVPDQSPNEGCNDVAALNFDSLAKDKDIFRQVCKFPHIPESLQRCRLSWSLISLHLLPSPLPGNHIEGASTARRDGVEQPDGR